LIVAILSFQNRFGNPAKIQESISTKFHEKKKLRTLKEIFKDHPKDSLFSYPPCSGLVRASPLHAPRNS
jgi:hypothetical protein